ncbi:MAG: type II secretion system protein [Candidatus Liptonbacteria bacterium]|nr:type II secretion system protein [Candidatus Liptonbacteria bacterium]
MSSRGFTLIELLIVIGVLAILVTTVLLTLNPAETLKQARDSTRVAELASLDKAIGFAVTQDPALALGVANTVYISLSDESSATCGSHSAFLPPLAPGWQYNCVNKANLQKANGTGWLPINLTGLPVAPINTLPVDKSNSDQAGLYYSYVTSNGLWELNADMESAKYKWGGAGDVESTDGGNTVVLYEKGSNLGLMPKEANWRIGYELKIPASCADGSADTSGIEFYSRWIPPGTGKVAVVKLLYWPGAQSFNPGSFMQMGLYQDGATAAQRTLLSDLVMMEGSGSNNWTSSTPFSVPVVINLGSTYVFGFGEDGVSGGYFAYDSSPYCTGTNPPYLPSPPPNSNGGWSVSDGFPLNSTAPNGGSDVSDQGIFGIYYSL